MWGINMKIKKLAIYGDSISTREFAGGGYEAGLKERLGLESIHNHAVSATSLSTLCEDNGIETSGIKILRQNPPTSDTDVVLVWYGTNDWYWGASLGKLEDDKEDTFLGAMRAAVRLIRSSAPHAKIVWLTPIFRMGLEGSGKDAYNCPNAAGFTLYDFYQAVADGC